VTSSPPDLSIVIEWENAGRIGWVRARAMLAQLRRQLLALPPGSVGKAEILLVYEAGRIDEGLLRAAVEEHRRWPAAIRYLGSDCAGYYEQKNYGAERTSGDIIVFLDSDVVPQPGWLEALLAPFASCNAEIVAGATSVERTGLYSTAMALGWIFPLPPEDRAVGPTRLFYANNVAFRREMIAAMRFPRARQYRVQVGVVQRRLAAGRYRLVASPDAAALHPPPQGLAAFFTRALWCGYDAASELPWRGMSLVWRAPRVFASQARAALGRVRRERRRAGLGWAGAAAASGVIAAYQAVRLFGYLGGLIASRPTWRCLNRIAP
jgi:glycosyltransferase involved in cell wall biosynthesis